MERHQWRDTQMKIGASTLRATHHVSREKQNEQLHVRVYPCTYLPLRAQRSIDLRRGTATCICQSAVNQDQMSKESTEGTSVSKRVCRMVHSRRVYLMAHRSGNPFNSSLVQSRSPYSLSLDYATYYRNSALEVPRCIRLRLKGVP